MTPDHLLFLTDRTISSEFRLLVIFTIFLSIAAFLLSSFSVYLFYKFYRDTIKPLPKLLLNSAENSISLKLFNMGNNPFYIHKFFISKGDKITSTIVNFLPLINEGTGYMSYTPVIDGRKVAPDQHVKIFEFDLAQQQASISIKDIQNVIDHLNGLNIEAHCHDIGKKYETVIRKKIVIDPGSWQKEG